MNGYLDITTFTRKDQYGKTVYFAQSSDWYTGETCIACGYTEEDAKKNLIVQKLLSIFVTYV